MTSEDMTSDDAKSTAPVDAGVMPKCCETCVWIHRFEPREDEKRRGLVIGCKKPGYEGYSSPLRMACDGVFWSPNRSA